MNLAVELDRPFRGEKWRSKKRERIAGVVKQVTTSHVLFEAKGFGVTSIPFKQFTETFQRDEPDYKVLLGKKVHP